jgi:hypothetical protein
MIKEIAELFGLQTSDILSIVKIRSNQQIIKNRVKQMGMFLLLVLFAGCDINFALFGRPNQVQEEEITINNEDGLSLAGKLFRANQSNSAVVLTHSGVLGEDQERLHPIARGLAEKGITTLTFALFVKFVCKTLPILFSVFH